MRASFLVFVLILAAGRVSAEEMAMHPGFSLLQLQAAPADTTPNSALQEMLSQFEGTAAARRLPNNGWTFKVHRYLGYTIVAATATQVVLGISNWKARKDGREPGAKTAHKYLGYSTAGLSLVQASLGYTNFFKMRKEKEGRAKRIVHLGLSTLATAGFVTAAVIARNARHDIEDGTANREHKTFDDLYTNHRTAGILSAASVALTVVVVEW